MAANGVVTILIQAKDEASKVLRATAANTKGVFANLRAGARDAVREFGGLRGAINATTPARLVSGTRTFFSTLVQGARQGFKEVGGLTGAFKGLAGVLSRIQPDISTLIALGGIAEGLKKAGEAADEFAASQRRLSGAATLVGAPLEFMQQLAKKGREEFDLGSAEANDYAAELVTIAAKTGDLNKATGALNNVLNLGAAQGLKSAETLQLLALAADGDDRSMRKLFNQKGDEVFALFAASVGKTTDQLTEADKATAFLTTATQKGALVQGEYEKFLKSTQGALAHLSDEQQTYSQKIGEQLAPVRKVGAEVFLFLLKMVNAFLKGLQFAANGVAAGIGGIIGHFYILEGAVKKFLGDLVTILPKSLVKALGFEGVAATLAAEGDKLIAKGKAIRKAAQDELAAGNKQIAAGDTTGTSTGNTDAAVARANARIQAEIRRREAALIALKVAAARRDEIEHEGARELAVQKAINATSEAANDAYYNQSLTSLKQFYDEKLRLAKEDAENQVKQLQTDIAVTKATPAITKDERIARDTKVKDLQAQLDQAEIASGQRVIEITNERYTAEKALADARLQFEQKIQEAQGKTFESALVDIQLEARKLNETLIQSGVPDAQRKQQVTEFSNLLRKRAEFARDEEAAGRLMADLDRDREGIQQQLATGKIDEEQATEKTADLERQRLPALQSIADDATRLANEIGDPALQQAAAALNAEFNGLAASADLAGKQAAEMKATIEDIAKSSFAEFFTSGLDRLGEANPDQRQINKLQLQQETIAAERTALERDAELGSKTAAEKVRALSAEYDNLGGQIKRASEETYNLSDAFRDFALSIVKALQQAMAQMLALKLVESLFSGGLPSAPALGNLGSEAAAAPKFAFSKGGRVRGYADGGIITGPGGPRSDRVMIAASNGEGMVTAAAMNQIGEQGLAFINSLGAPGASKLGPMKASEVKGAATRTVLDGYVGIGLDEGLLEKRVEGTMLKVLKNRPRSVRHALGLP